MHHRSVWAAVLAMGLGAGVVATMRGQEPAGNASWLSRFGSRGTPSASKKDEKKDNNVPPAAPKITKITRAQAQEDFLRRLQVCDKLREIAFESGDSELMHKVDQLEQRVADAFARQTNRAADTSSLDDDLLQGRLGAKTGGGSFLSGNTRQSDGRTAAEGRK